MFSRFASSSTARQVWLDPPPLLNQCSWWMGILLATPTPKSWRPWVAFVAASLVSCDGFTGWHIKMGTVLVLIHAAYLPCTVPST